MLNYEELSRFRENNRIEAKKAKGGLPESIWETYSAFANTLGGVILLGVVERKDYSLYPVGVESAKEMVEEFLNQLPKMANKNILRSHDVVIESAGDKEIIIINVPRAKRSQKPIYIGSSAQSGTYKRDGEGDYHCTKEEVDSMLADAAIVTFDMQTVPYRAGMLKETSVKAYEERTKAQLKIGDSTDVATVLLLGTRDAVREVAPNFTIKYSAIGEKEEQHEDFDNVYDFFAFIEKEVKDIALSPVTYLSELLKEAVVNAILNADFEAGGIECLAKLKFFEIKNNGNFCVDKNLAITGGISQVRNERLSDLFIDIVGERKGSGLSTIYWYWNSLSLINPQIEESHSPDMITFTLNLKTKPERTVQSGIIYEQLLIGLLTLWPKKRLGGLYQAYSIPKEQCEQILNNLIERNIVVKEGRYYKLKR